MSVAGKRRCTMKVLINECYGGYGLSQAAYEWLGLDEWNGYGFAYATERNHPRLVAMLEALGSEAASDSYAKLKIVEIPDGVEYIIEEYDGLEWVSEKHHVWR